MRTVAKKQKAETLPEIRKEAPLPAIHDPKRFRRFGNVGITDMEIPALKLLQGLSPEVKENHALRAGHFYHSILEQDLGEELEGRRAARPSLGRSCARRRMCAASTDRARPRG